MSNKKVVTQLTWDWKESPELDDLRAALKPFGIHIYQDPFCEGTDQYGYILSNRVLTKQELKEIGYGDKEPPE